MSQTTLTAVCPVSPWLAAAATWGLSGQWFCTKKTFEDWLHLGVQEIVPGAFEPCKQNMVVRMESLLSLCEGLERRVRLTVWRGLS